MSELQSTPPEPPKRAVEPDFSEAIASVLEVIRAVGRGDLSRRLEPIFPEAHPIGALTVSVNAMIESLAAARERSERYSAELQEKLFAIDQQQAAIQELSTPIMEVWQGVLCLPIVGVVDSVRTADMARSLLSAVVARKAQFALIDITGIQVMDTQAVDHFIHMARAVRMLGARCVLSGVHPNVSRTVVHMGVDLQGIETHRSMRDALRHFISNSLKLQSKSKTTTSRGERPVDSKPEVAQPSTAEGLTPPQGDRA